MSILNFLSSIIELVVHWRFTPVEHGSMWSYWSDMFVVRFDTGYQY